jgi:uncharacterized protein (DUF58 family)
MAGRLFDEDFLRRLQQLAVIAKRVPATSAAGGQRRSRRLGDGLEFADYRGYAPGDDLRFLDWPYYARMERLLIRLFHEHSEGAVSILLDSSASMAVGAPAKFDYARQAAAALAFVSMAGLDRVHLAPFDEHLRAEMHTGRNRGQILPVLDFLERLETAGQTRVSPPVEEFIRRNPQNGTVILISDLMDIPETPSGGAGVHDELSRALLMLRRRRDEVIILHVVDPAEAEPALSGPTQLAATETNRSIDLTITPAVLADYRRRWQQYVHKLQAVCLSRGATYIQAPTSQPFDRLVLRTLQNHSR